MKRRTFLSAAGAAIGAAALRDTVQGVTAPGTGDLVGRPSAPVARPTSLPASSRVVVVGAGAFGGWTALHLAERGVAVTLVDAYGPGSARATSGDETRGLRFAYGDREFYTRWALDALERWKTRQEAWQDELMVTTGRLMLVPEVAPALRTTKEILDRNGIPCELLSPDDLRRRWPQIGLDGVGGALHEPDATTIRANRACRVVADAVARAGGEVRIGRVRSPDTGAGGRVTALVLDDGESLQADAFVFACGSWLPRLFPELLGPRIIVPRRDVFLFGPPAGDPRFSVPNLPNFSEGSRSVYGFPDLDGVGFKVAPYGGMDPFDPDSDERVPAAHWLKRAREYMALRFPGMRDQPLVQSRVCQLENTTDEHFLIDRHPGMENVWIVGGGSGHGFKHGPALGEYAARRVLGEDPDPEATALWRIS
jgi:sarcosine oxidase